MAIETASSEENAKELTKDKVTRMMEEWLTGYQVFTPSHLFKEFPNLYPDLTCIIQNPLSILIETLEYFGLPQGYMDGQGHWKDWAKKI